MVLTHYVLVDSYFRYAASQWLMDRGYQWGDWTFISDYDPNTGLCMMRYAFTDAKLAMYFKLVWS